MVSFKLTSFFKYPMNITILFPVKSSPPKKTTAIIAKQNNAAPDIFAASG